MFNNRIRLISVLSVILICLFATALTVSADFDDITDYPFTDVKTGIWYEESAIYCFEHGYIQGTDNGVFSPDVPLTRSMAVQILYSMYASNETYEGINTFSDVPENSWYHNACEWAYANEITSGTGEGYFSPTREITRQDFACMLYKFYILSNEIHNKTPEPLNIEINTFDDFEEVSEYAKEALNWACNYGLLKGTDKNCLLPKETATRSQAVCIITSFEKAFWHNWSIDTIESKRTCSANGCVSYYCDECFASRTVNFNAYHIYTEYEYNRGLCTQGAVFQCSCKNCNQKFEKTVYLSHQWNSGEITKNPTCIENGNTLYTCYRCKGTYNESIPATGKHIFGSWITTAEPTKYQCGSKYHKCEFCTLTESELLRWDGYYQIQKEVIIPSGGYTVSTSNIGLKVIYINKKLLNSTSASYTSSTKNAVISFQKSKGINPTGVVDYVTWKALGYTEWDWYHLAAYVTNKKIDVHSSKEDCINAMVDTARDYAVTNTVYRIGCSGKPGTYADCSGLIYQCLYSVGINPTTNIIDHGLAKYEYTSRYLAADPKLGLSVSVSDIKKGDLIFYANSGSSTVIHVAIYAGNGKIYDAWPSIGTTYRGMYISGTHIVKVVRVFP